MSSERGPEERFAAAWDAADPTDVTGGAPPSATDPELARELRVAARLRAAGRATAGPDAEARRRMRARVMAAADGAWATDGAAADGSVPDNALAAPAATAAPTHPARSGSHAGVARGRRPTRTGRAPAATSGPGRGGGARPGERPLSRRARLLVRVTTAFCVVLAVGVLAVALSRGALPGDPLYGVKRVSEATELGLTSGQEATARKHLEFAALRLEELSSLVARDGDTLDPGQRALADDTLAAFTEQAEQAADLMLPLAGRPGSPRADALADWARAQDAHLDAIAPSLGPVDALGRSRALMDRMGAVPAPVPTPSRCPDGTAPEAGLCPAPPAPPAVDAPRPGAETASSATPETTTTRGPTTPPPTTTLPGPPRADGAPAVPPVPAAPLPGREPPGSGPASVPAPAPVPPREDLPPLIPGLPGVGVGAG